MTSSETTRGTPRDSGAPDAAAQGWYFYGITRRGPLAALLATTGDGHEVDSGPARVASDAAALQLLEFSGLAAVVRPVPLADFSVAGLRERLQDASELETMVRSHNRVIEAIHARQAILPAKFGVVYTNPEEVVSALQPAHDALLHQLHRLEGCDEWAVHLYADRAAVRKRIAREDPAIRRLRDERAMARPGRGYFLEQQLHDALEVATDHALSAIAQSAFDRLLRHAVAGEVNPIGSSANQARDVEILRAAFLVARDAAERFEDAVHSSTDTSEGLRCESSGPWPPYSFAARDDEAGK